MYNMYLPGWLLGQFKKHAALFKNEAPLNSHVLPHFLKTRTWGAPNFLGIYHMCPCLLP